MKGTNHDLVIHTNITASSWGSTVGWSSTSVSGWSGSTVIKVISHLRVQLLGGLLGRTSATWTLATTRLTALAASRISLRCCCSRFWLRLWLGDTLAETLWWWNRCCLGGIDDNLNLFDNQRR